MKWRVVFKIEGNEFYFDFKYVSDAGEFIETAIAAYCENKGNLEIYIKPITKKEEVKDDKFDRCD